MPRAAARPPRGRRATRSSQRATRRRPPRRWCSSAKLNGCRGPERLSQLEDAADLLGTRRPPGEGVRPREARQLSHDRRRQRAGDRRWRRSPRDGRRAGHHRVRAPTSSTASGGRGPASATPAESRISKRASRSPIAGNSLESVRGYANLGNAFVEAGDLARAFELYERGRSAAAFRRRRPDPLVRGRARLRVLLAGRTGTRPSGLPTRSSPRPRRASRRRSSTARLIRGRIPLARDQAAPALEDSSRALELGRRAGYPDMVVPALALPSPHARTAGRSRKPTADELLSFWPERFPTSYWVADLAFTLQGLGRSQRLLEAAARARTSSQWLEAAGRCARATTIAPSSSTQYRLLPDELVSSRSGSSARRPRLAPRCKRVSRRLLPALADLGTSHRHPEGCASSSPTPSGSLLIRPCPLLETSPSFQRS